MSNLFAKRMEKVPKSFIREILKFTQSPDVISFAGGLPNPRFFPVEDVKKSTVKVLEQHGAQALQYSTTEGHLPLREFICDYYKRKKNLTVKPEEIIITNGAQQAIALLCKTFLNKGEKVVLERPAYLGAIQAISFYEPEFHSVDVDDDGINIEQLEDKFKKHEIKLVYSVVNFSNPTGITYSLQKRKEMARVLGKYNTLFLEDDPYFEWRYEGEHLPSVKSYLDRNVIMIGSFSKIVSPGFRIGWICAPTDMMEKINISKQAADLHSSTFAQYVLHQYLTDYDVEVHLKTLRQVYNSQKNAMIESIEKYFPEECKFTRPEGGMFLWVTMPSHISARDLLALVLPQKLAFVPGDTMYVDGTGLNTMRLNYTNSPEDKIEKGIKILSDSIKKLLAEAKTTVSLGY
jgi:2-aminoadipate transaminase